MQLIDAEVAFPTIRAFIKPPIWVSWYLNKSSAYAAVYFSMVKCIVSLISVCVPYNCRGTEASNLKLVHELWGQMCNRVNKCVRTG